MYATDPHQANDQLDYDVSMLIRWTLLSALPHEQMFIFRMK